MNTLQRNWIGTLRDVWWIFRLELRIARKDPSVFAILFVMPLTVLYLVAPAMRPALMLQGHMTASGAEQAMPGMAVLFGNFAMAFLAFAIFREHTWNTWERLMIAPLSRSAVIAGKALLPFGLVILQQFFLLWAALVIFDVQITGSPGAYLMLTVAFALFTVAAGLALTAWLGSLQQINAVINISSLVLGGIGGAFTPIELMPAWIRTISVLSPNYWAIGGFKAIILNGAGLSQVAFPAALLAALAAACFGIALIGLRGDARKRAWA
jgi:ABC-2 type transport system permease protein